MYNCRINEYSCSIHIYVNILYLSIFTFAMRNSLRFVSFVQRQLPTRTKYNLYTWPTLHFHSAPNSLVPQVLCVLPPLHPFFRLRPTVFISFAGWHVFFFKGYTHNHLGYVAIFTFAKASACIYMSHKSPTSTQLHVHPALNSNGKQNTNANTYRAQSFVYRFVLLYTSWKCVLLSSTWVCPRTVKESDQVIISTAFARFVWLFSHFWMECKPTELTAFIHEDYLHGICSTMQRMCFIII